MAHGLLLVVGLLKVLLQLYFDRDRRNDTQCFFFRFIICVNLPFLVRAISGLVI
jgi:hypothetical protein